MAMDVKTFRDNLFAMNTRRFGKVAEIIVQKLINAGDSPTIHHDLNNGTERIEVKFSRAEKKHGRSIMPFNVLSVVESEGLSVRMFPFMESTYTKFNCNIQQIKPAEFDLLIYGLMFADRVLFFMVTPDQLKNKGINYSNKQHKGNVGEGQFHVTQRNLEYHMNNHHWLTLSYADLMSLLRR